MGDNIPIIYLFGGRQGIPIAIDIFYRASDTRQKDFVVNISMYSLSVHLSKFVCDLRDAEDIPNIE